MISKIITILYLISLLSALWMICRHQLRLDNELMLRKVLTVIFSGYIMAVTFIYTNTLHWEKPLLFLAVLSFCPFVWLLITILKIYKYEGDFSILILSIMLNSLGLVVLYRLDISSGWLLCVMKGTSPWLLNSSCTA